MARTGIIKPAQREIPVDSEGLWPEALAAWDARMDMDRAIEAADLFEEIAEEEEENPDAWAWCARACFYVGDYQEREKDRGRWHERGASQGRKGIALLSTHIGALFWTACCVGSYMETLHVLKRAFHAPEVVKCLKKVYDLQPEYYHHGLSRYLGQAISRQPLLTEKFLKIAMPDLSADRVMEDLRSSIANDPPFVLTCQTLGEVAYHVRKDRGTAREMLDLIGQLDLDAAPNLAPENHRDLPRARQKLQALL